MKFSALKIYFTVLELKELGLKIKSWQVISSPLSPQFVELWLRACDDCWFLGETGSRKGNSSAFVHPGIFRPNINQRLHPVHGEHGHFRRSVRKKISIIQRRAGRVSEPA